MHEPAPVALAPRNAPLGHVLRWRVLSIVAFLALMLGLLATAVFALFVPARPLTGLPDDPDVAAARALVHGTLAIPLGPLRFACALTGPAAVADLGHAATAADVARAR
ncbi:MAG TPA: hypothetical protein VFK69_05220, partial [Candidatus Eisenbacteria bacterium]|nr:hypothetical protein [Candidatus Eisenbacteria bacterium]